MRNDSLPSNSGQLVVIAGCMFAGKTARLIDRLEAARATGKRVLAVKHHLDSRYHSALLCTHDGRTFAAVSVADAGELLRVVSCAEVAGVDEAQFFGRSLAPVCQQLVAAGRTVIVAGIDHDTWGQPFPPLPELKSLANEVEQRHPPCGVCGQPATFHQRIAPVVNADLIGGPGEYEPRCTAHFAPLPPPAPRYE